MGAMDPLLAGKRAVSVGTSALKNMRAFVGRGAKISTPITMVCGAIADLASTIAKFSVYLLIFSICTALVSGLLWFFRYRRQFLQAAADGVMQPEEVMQLGERNAWSVTFAFSVVASVVMGGFVIAERLSGSDKGVLAATIPGMDKVQDALFRVEKKLDDVKKDTVAIREDVTAVKTDTVSIKKDAADIKTDTARIATSVEEIARRFDALAGTGGIIPNAKTPEEHYHNARIHELGGNFGAARKAYVDYLQANLDVLDPWLNYSAMLKVQEGRAGAAEALRYFGEKAEPKTASYRTALALLEEAPARIAKLEEIAKSNPDFGPAFYLLSQEYSEVKRGDVTLADQRAERDWLEKFRAAHSGGKFLKYFLDKKEAEKWIENAEARWVKLNSSAVRMDNPVSLSAMQSNSGWAVVLTLGDYTAKEMFYRLDGQGEFKSTGHLPNQSPQTGRPMINPHVPLPNLSPGEHSIEVRYVDKNDQSNGPYTLKFSTADQQLAQGKMMLNAAAGSWLSFRDYDGKVLLYFTTLMSYRPIIKEIRYSLNSDDLGQTWKFKPSNKMFEVGEELYTSVPKNTEFANVQVTFKDGTKSDVHKVVRVKGE
jgi:hypothetical protein